MTWTRNADRWVIVLAGGGGTRLQSVTTARSGLIVPKQYCSLAGGRSLLADTIARAELLTSRERIVVVVAQEHARFWEPEFVGARVHVVVQPRNRGTAAGVLLPLLAIEQMDPDAIVTLLPSDHHVADESSLANTLLAALDANGPHATLIGMPADAPTSDYGWILPAAGHGPTRAVEGFVEKPAPAIADSLLRRGAVWNSMILVARVPALLALYQRRQPRLLAEFRGARPLESPRAAARLYERTADLDFSRDVLEGSESELEVRIAAPCGWTDLGTPERLCACLRLELLRRAAVPAACESPLDLATAVELAASGQGNA